LADYFRFESSDKDRAEQEDLQIGGSLPPNRQLWWKFAQNLVDTLGIGFPKFAALIVPASTQILQGVREVHANLCGDLQLLFDGGALQQSP
jgi:hypothetical protein